MKQRELYRTSILAKLYGCLVLLEVRPQTNGPGKCPQCGATEFVKDWWSEGWTSCDNDDCDFEILTAHLDEIQSQWPTQRRATP